MTDVIIIGAGAAGLMAANKLSQAGLTVCVLEARDRIGGRIYTFKNEKVEKSFEGGAEFIHGNLTETLTLLKEAGIGKREIKGEFWNVDKGQWSQQNVFFENTRVVIKRLKEIKEDISIAAFLDKYFSDDKFSGLRKSLSSYVEGYYSGEINRISAKAFYEEWMSEDEQQYRPANGYGELIHYLVDKCRKAGGTIKLSTVVKEIKWSEGQAEVVDETNQSYLAKKVMITVPLGVWTAEADAKAAIRYMPSLPHKIDAARQMGFGSAIKILLYFKDAFWKDEEIKKRTKTDTTDLHMVLSEMPIPTWWTQVPADTSLITGWLSGPKAAQMKDEDDATVLQAALESLCAIFGVKINVLKEKLLWSKIFNWTKDPFTLGSYSYSTLQTNEARKALTETVRNTLFFAGEALYDGPEMGTVEAALISGKEIAEQILLA